MCVFVDLVLWVVVVVVVVVVAVVVVVVVVVVFEVGWKSHHVNVDTSAEINFAGALEHSQL